MMMLPEMTDSAVARAFRRFARGAVVGLALAGLAACGGGGGKATTTPEATPQPAPTRTPAPTPAPGTTPRPPEMTITPPADEEPDTIEDAVAITAGKAVSGTLSSPTDVDFFRLPLAEPGTATFWTTGEADTVVTLLDEEGDDLSAATTSEDRVRVTTALDDVYARVTGREDGRTGNYNLHNEFEPEEEQPGNGAGGGGGTPSVYACFALSNEGYGLCGEYLVTGEEDIDECLAGQERAQTCPRTGSAEMITSCRPPLRPLRHPGGGFNRVVKETFYYNIHFASTLEANRSGCERAGGRFTIHKRPSELLTGSAAAG